MCSFIVCLIVYSFIHLLIFDLDSFQKHRTAAFLFLSAQNNKTSSVTRCGVTCEPRPPPPPPRQLTLEDH